MIKTLHMYLQNQRTRVIALAHERADNLEESARLLRLAAEKGDLARIGWITRTLCVDLSVQATTLHNELNVGAGNDASQRAERGRQHCRCGDEG